MYSEVYGGRIIIDSLLSDPCVTFLALNLITKDDSYGNVVVFLLTNIFQS